MLNLVKLGAISFQEAGPGGPNDEFVREADEFLTVDKGTPLGSGPSNGRE
jgi:hypothetical protein